MPNYLCPSEFKIPCQHFRADFTLFTITSQSLQTIPLILFGQNPVYIHVSSSKVTLGNFPFLGNQLGPPLPECQCCAKALGPADALLPDASTARRKSWGIPKKEGWQTTGCPVHDGCQQSSKKRGGLVAPELITIQGLEHSSIPSTCTGW